LSPESLEALASVGGLLLALIGLPLVYLQLRDVQRSVRGGAHATVPGGRGSLVAPEQKCGGIRAALHLALRRRSSSQ
jgi:hypothetical protein